MQMCGVFKALGPDVFRNLVRGISIGKLKTYQVYERFKARALSGDSGDYEGLAVTRGRVVRWCDHAHRSAEYGEVLGRR